MRPIALGRKNWIHLGSQQAGPRSPPSSSVMETCKRLQIPVRDYLAHVLPRLANPTGYPTRTTYTLRLERNSAKQHHPGLLCAYWSTHTERPLGTTEFGALRWNGRHGDSWRRKSEAGDQGQFLIQARFYCLWMLNKPTPERVKTRLARVRGNSVRPRKGPVPEKGQSSLGFLRCAFPAS